MKSPITTHVLDTSAGKPARGITVVLERAAEGVWRELGRGSTNDDGRVADLLPAESSLAAGTYRLVFHVAGYFGGRDSFYSTITVEFDVKDPAGHYHVPLLLSPFGYATYRGS